MHSNKNSSRRRPNERKTKPNSKKFRASKPTKKTDEKASGQASEGIRLNKYIANAGICSRREADVYIASGSATVNGVVVTEMGYKVQPTDIVTFDGMSITPEEKRYIVLNKPKNFITAIDDDRGRRTVMELIANATRERIYPVGRLDRSTTGLLLFTNDGELVKKLTNPKKSFIKLYHVSLDRKLSIKDMNKIEEGVVVDGKKVFIDEISYIQGASKSEIGLKIHSGRNKIISKVFKQFDYKVTKLDRVIYGSLTKKNLPRGHWRALTQQEIINLKMI